MSELIKALVAARKEIGGAKKDKINPAFKSKYADLGAVMDAAEPLEKHGLAFVQDIENGAVVTVILHESGETARFAPVPIINSKGDAQGQGSGITYSRRYSLSTALGIPQEDDDGAAASKPAEKRFPSAVESASEGIKLDAITMTRLTRVSGALTDLVMQEIEDGIDNEYKIWELIEPIEDNDEKLYLSKLLGSSGSRVRARLKVIGAKKRAEAQTAA